MPVLSYKYRLYPNAAQVDALEAMLGAFCDLYNAGLQQRIEAYRRQGITLTYATQARELKAVRTVDERLAGYSFSAEQQVLRRLDKTYKAFFGRVKKGRTGGFPRFKSKSQFGSAEFRVGDGLTLRKSRRLGIVGIPGEIKVKWYRALPTGAKVGAAVLSRAVGRWHVCFQITLPDEVMAHKDGAAVGIDVGLSSLIATSDGDTVPAPQWARKAAKRQRRLQRALARCRRGGSKRRLKAKRTLARHTARTARQRRDFTHKLSRSLVERYAFIALEDLNIDGLARSMFAQSVHDAAWGQLRQMLEYKAASAGVRLEVVDPRGTSQTCPGCGAVAAKTLSERTHRCGCGCVMDRDVAAALVILHRASSQGPGHDLRTLSQRVAP